MGWSKEHVCADTSKSLRNLWYRLRKRALQFRGLRMQSFAFDRRKRRCHNELWIISNAVKLRGSRPRKIVNVLSSGVRLNVRSGHSDERFILFYDDVCWNPSGVRSYAACGLERLQKGMSLKRISSHQRIPLRGRNIRDCLYDLNLHPLPEHSTSIAYFLRSSGRHRGHVEGH